MKKRTKITIVICICIALFGVGVGLTVMTEISKSMALQEVNEIELAQVEDGTYIGTAKNEIVFVEVEAVVIDQQITKIDITKHNNGLGGKAEQIVDDVLSNQTLEVDAISGATYSSNIILKAIENALEKGLKH